LWFKSQLNKSCHIHTRGFVAFITIIIVVVSVVFVGFVVVVVVVVAVVVVGAWTVQSVQRLGYEMVTQRIAIRFLRPISALAITESPISGYQPEP
jgi:hypothetical protein